MKFINSRGDLEFLLSRIIFHHQMNIEIKECFELFPRVEQKLKSYVTEKSLQDLCLGQLGPQSLNSCPRKNKELAKLLRVLVSYFYKKECVGSILLSKKLCK